MAALSPTVFMDPDGGEAESMELDPRTRDELILKLIARVERIDTENEEVVENLRTNTKTLKAVRHDQGVLIDEVNNLSKKVETMSELLREVLSGLYESAHVVGQPPRAYRKHTKPRQPTLVPQQHAAPNPAEQPDDREDEG